MNVTFTQWYAISLGSVAIATIVFSHLGLVFLWLLYTYSKDLFYRRFWYPLLIQRRYWGSISRGQGIFIAVYIAANGFCMGLGMRDSSDLTSDLISRTGVMASINMVPLFFGGRTSILVDLLGISVHGYYLMHHWIGRMVALQGLLHAALVLAKKESWTFDANHLSGLSSASALALLLLLSLHLIRRAAYEFFLGTHMLFAIVAVVALFIHLLAKGGIRYAYPLTAIGLWTANCVIRLIRVLHHNVGRRDSQQNQASIILHDRPETNSVSGLTLTVWPKRPVHVRNGHYYYLYFSDMGLRNKFQGHPFVVSWWDKPVGSKTTALSFLISPKKGLTMALAGRKMVGRVILDGPYGRNLRLESYETALLFAKGIGIAGILPHALNLVERRNDDDVASRSGIMTRKVDLVWILEENCQEQWVESWIERLKEKDPRRLILSVLCYLPNSQAGSPSSTDPYYKKVYGEQPKLRALINREVEVTPGRTMIAVCGDPEFSSHLRSIAVDSMQSSQDITFEEVEFRPGQMTHTGRVNGVALEEETLKAQRLMDVEVLPSSLT